MLDPASPLETPAFTFRTGGEMLESVREFGVYACRPDELRKPLWQIRKVAADEAATDEPRSGQVLRITPIDVVVDKGQDPATEGDGSPVSRRARPAWPRGVEGRRLLAQRYRVAQEQGADPVLAVMCATGHSRRKSLRLIAQARDAGFLTPRHVRC